MRDWADYVVNRPPNYRQSPGAGDSFGASPAAHNKEIVP